jgi:DNA gyrase subunit B
MGRNRRFQAILPLRGKILNIERASFDKIIASAEIGTIIKALGVGIGEERFDADKLRYHRVIIMTDADVDGSHIRCLLLTFFFRQMRALVERGHICIAQAPLYRLAKGSSQIYLADDAELEEQLLSTGMKNAVLTGPTGILAAGAVLENIVQRSRDLVPSFRELGRLCNNQKLPQALAAAGALTRELLMQPGNVEREVGVAMALLDGIETIGQLWRPAQIDGQWLFSRKVDGVEDEHALDSGAMVSPSFERAAAMDSDLQALFAAGVWLSVGSETRRVLGPVDLIEGILALGRKGSTIQRYKGLGEMNSEQLWTTTLDPDQRTLKRVTLQDEAKTEEEFEIFMSSNVDARRELLESMSADGVNLDV